MLRVVGEWVLAWLKKPAFWIVGLLGVGVGNAIVDHITEYIKEDVFPSLACEVHELRRTPADGSRFTVLVSTLAGDTDGRQTKFITHALEGEKGFERVATCRSLAIDDNELPGSMATEEAERTGRAWLEQFHADVLIWGAVSGSDKSLRLSFLTTQAGEAGRAYPLHPQTLELPSSFDEQIATQLVTVALAAITPATEETGRYLVDRLRPLQQKLDRLRQHPPHGATPRQQADIAVAVGLANQVIGEQAGDTVALTNAVAAFRDALTKYTRADVPL
ncbi:hypothetical protein, partial [Pararhodospirillum oryzae]|uniref:hypothetical protein n=1 Tax=Pararhodospirillum oryzae TaxID=478448 RepID=UPI0011BE3E53